MSAITDFLASQRAGFISLRDLLEAMVRHGDGCTFKQAATALSQIIREDTGGPLGSTFWGSYSLTEGIQRKLCLPLRGGLQEPDALLEDVANTGEFEADTALYRVYGFRTEDILPLLERRGITLDFSLKDRTGLVQGGDLPAWKRGLALRRTLNHYEAGCVLSGVDPYDGHKWDESRMMRDVVLEAIENNEIEFEYSSRENGDVVIARSLAAWCEKNSIPWPLPCKHPANPS